MNRSLRQILRGGAAVAAIAVVVILASPASAHVEAQGETAADGLTTVTFSFSHGCTSSPTSSLKVKLPPTTTEVKPESPASWSSTVDRSQLTWTGGPIADHDPGAFTTTMRLVGTKGETVYLPTVQGCEQGENAWIELTPDAEADNAAPRIVLAETVVPTGATPSNSAVTAATSPSDPVAARDAHIIRESENSPVGVIVIIVVIAIIVVTAGILYLRNRRPSAP